VKVLGDRTNKVDVKVISANNYSIALKETPPHSCMLYLACLELRIPHRYP